MFMSRCFSSVSGIFVPDTHSDIVLHTFYRTTWHKLAWSMLTAVHYCTIYIFMLLLSVLFSRISSRHHPFLYISILWIMLSVVFVMTLLTFFLLAL